MYLIDMRLASADVGNSSNSSGSRTMRRPCFFAFNFPSLIASRTDVRPMPVIALASSGDSEKRSASGTLYPSVGSRAWLLLKERSTGALHPRQPFSRPTSKSSLAVRSRT